MENVKLRIIHGIFMFLIGVALLTCSTFGWFNVDWISIALLLFITVLPYLGYVKRISYGDATLDMEKDVEQFSQDVAKLKRNEKESKEYQESETLIENLEKRDPELACMKLKMMLEMITRDVLERTTGKSVDNISAANAVEILYDKKVIDKSLRDFSREFLYYSGRISHGQSVADDMYKDLIDAGLVLLDAYYDVIDELSEKPSISILNRSRKK